MYHFYLGDMELPMAPEKYSLCLPKRSEVMRLADGSEVSIARPCGLREISFEMLLPYFADSPLVKDGVEVYRPIYYLKKMAQWAEDGKARRLIIYRTLPDGTEIFNTNMSVDLLGYEVLEAADLGFDIKVAVQLREHIEPSVKKHAV